MFREKIMKGELDVFLDECNKGCTYLYILSLVHNFLGTKENSQLYDHITKNISNILKKGLKYIESCVMKLEKLIYLTNSVKL